MGFIGKVLDDREKSVNPIHVIMIIMVLNCIGWVWYLIIKNHVMPALDGIAMILGGGGVANLAQKAEEIVSKLRKPHDEDKPTPSADLK